MDHPNKPKYAAMTSKTIEKGTVETVSKETGNKVYPSLDEMKEEVSNDESDDGYVDDSSFEKKANKNYLANLQSSSSNASSSTPGSSPSPKIRNMQRDDNFYGTHAYGIVIAVIIAVLIAVVSGIVYYSSKELSPPQQRPPATNAEELYELQHLFPRQPIKTWASIVAGVKTLYKSDPQKPCILLFLVVDNQTDTSINANMKTEECIAKLVAKKVISHMGLNNSPAIVDSGSLQAENYGKIINVLRELLRSEKALILTNLQDMSGSVAESLHVLCDRENPAVSNALIAMTLRTSIYVEGFNHASLIQHVLWNKWMTHVKEDKLPALITRVLPIVNAVVQEKSLPSECDELDFTR